MRAPPPLALALLALPPPTLPTHHPSSPYSCPFRQLAYRYADALLAGRGLANIQRGLNLSDGGCAAPPQLGAGRAARPRAGADYVGWSARAASAESLARTVFVDPERGADAADGTQARPLRSLRAAQAAARRLAPGATVVLRGGTHWLGGTGPLLLTPADSGTHWTSFDGTPLDLGCWHIWVALFHECQQTSCGQASTR